MALALADGTGLVDPMIGYRLGNRDLQGSERIRLLIQPA
jgi:hypothetical protein